MTTNTKPSFAQVEQLLQARGEDALDEVLNVILEYFSCVTGTIHVLNCVSGLLDLKAQRGIPDSILETVSKIPIGKGMAGLAAKRHAAVQVCNLQTDQSGKAKPAAKDTKMEGCIAAPMFLQVGQDDELFGILGVAKPTAYDYSQEEIADLDDFGRIIAKALS
ncbi:MAG: GAF domain-containing protein [Verrucomicrobiales bacterium]|nr:GAF domain-containing protein [Verrucomicrobiales bacterium]